MILSLLILRLNVIYTDFAMTFDWVNRDALLKVHTMIGFGEFLLWWFGSFLSNRKQWIHGVEFDIIEAFSGSLEEAITPLCFFLYLSIVLICRIAIYTYQSLLAIWNYLFLIFYTSHLLQSDIYRIVFWANNSRLS